jgi:hypothetical protein
MAVEIYRPQVPPRSGVMFKSTSFSINKYSCMTVDWFPGLLDEHLRTTTRRMSSFSLETWKICQGIVLIFIVCRAERVGMLRRHA